MNLLTLFFVTQTAYAIIGILFFIVLISLGILIFLDLSRLNKKVQKLADESLETAAEAREFIEKIGKSAIGYLMIKILRIIDKNRKKEI